LSKLLWSLFLSGLMALSGSALAASDKSWPIDVVVGKSDAPITIIEYSSLTCPHCARFQADIMPQIKKDWVDTGKAKVILRDFVWDPLAQAAAMLSHCAGERYPVFVDTFFHSQANWIHAAQPLDALKGIARLGGMPADAVDKCLQDRNLLNEINARKEDAEKVYGIGSTPTFVINGKVVNNTEVPTYESFAKLLTEQKK
jgi:protein-disulfide isomerase